MFAQIQKLLQSWKCCGWFVWQEEEPEATETSIRSSDGPLWWREPFWRYNPTLHLSLFRTMCGRSHPSQHEGVALETGAGRGKRADAWLGGGGGVWAAVDPVLEQDGRIVVQGGVPSCQRTLDGALWGGWSPRRASRHIIASKRCCQRARNAAATERCDCTATEMLCVT